jgi:hypothetical protein
MSTCLSLEPTAERLCELLHLPKEQYAQRLVDGRATVFFEDDNFDAASHQSAIAVFPALVAMLAGRTIKSVEPVARNGKQIHFGIETDTGDWFSLELRSIVPRTSDTGENAIALFDGSLVRPQNE